MLKLFSASWCPACKQVKNFLIQNSIKFDEIDIDKDYKSYEILKALKIKSIPVTYIDNENYVIGTDFSKILKLIQSK